VDDYRSTSEDKLVDLLSAPSSLKSLYLHTENIPSHAVYLKSNTNLTRLELHSVFLGIPEDQIPALIDIVNCNRTLNVMVLRWFNARSEGWINSLRPLISALHENKSLQRIEIHTDYKRDVSHYMTTYHKELILDSRITWKDISVDVSDVSHYMKIHHKS
jgi:hypothetical protein